MTTDSILSMTPAELREAIAKKKGYECKHGFMDDACINPKDYWVTPEGRLTSILPDWSANIADAWELVKEMPDPEIYRGTYINDVDYWRCACGSWDYDEPEYECEAETAELAISRCWLMWKEGEKNE